jgi:hypothetical protein
MKTIYAIVRQIWFVTADPGVLYLAIRGTSFRPKHNLTVKVK